MKLGARLASSLFAIAIATQGHAAPLPSGVGVYLNTYSAQFGFVGNGSFSYASGPGISTANPGGFQEDSAGSFNNNIVNPAPIGFSPDMTTASLEQLSTSANGTSTARAEASLEQGILRATANSNNGYETTCGTPTCITSTSTMSATSVLKDLVTFHLPGLSSAIVQLSAHVDGSVGAFDYTAATSQLTFTYAFSGGTGLGDGGFQYLASGNYNGANGDPSILLSGFTGGIIEEPTFSNATYAGFDFTGHMTVTDGLTLPLYVALQADGRDGMTTDFGNTASFAFGLPDGVSFTSASGVLLTVPEPGTSALMLFGLVGVGSLARRRHQA